MRILKMAMALGLMAGGLGLSTAASAQHHGDTRIENRADYNRHVLGIGDGRRDSRHYNRSDRHDRGHSYRRSRSCRTEWRHHRRVRVCR